MKKREAAGSIYLIFSSQEQKFKILKNCLLYQNVFFETFSDITFHNIFVCLANLKYLYL